MKMKVNKKGGLLKKNVIMQLSKGYQNNQYIRYQDSWETQDEYKGWLRRSIKKPGFANCSICDLDLVPKTTNLKTHLGSIGHKTKLNPSFLGDIEKKAVRAELKFTAYVASQNLPKRAIDTLIPVVKNVITDSEIIKNVHLDRCRVGEIMNRILAPAHIKNLSEILKNNKFSIIVDESTDVSTTHSMCIVVRYVDNEQQKINETLWDLVEIYTAPNEVASADRLKELIVKSFESKDVSINNISGFCADTCNLMMGEHNSVSSKLKQDISYILINKCNCHIQHLSAKYAYDCLPNNILNLLSSITNYINGSPKRLKYWTFLQEGSKVDALRPINPCFTRWLTVCHCVTYLLSRWTALTQFFKEQSDDKRNPISATEIHELLCQPQTKIYYEFLEFALTKFNITNALLQSVAPISTKSHNRMILLLIEILHCFINKDYIDSHIDDLSKIDPQNEKEWLHLNALDIGKFAHDSLFTMELVNEEERKNILSSCRKFFVTTCLELQTRLNLNEKFTSSLDVFNQDNALSCDFHKLHPNLNDIFEVCPVPIPEIVKNKINHQWSNLLKYEIPEDIRIEGNVDVFWIKILSCKDEENNILFQELSNFALDCFVSVANSNASAERVWSSMNLIKTNKKNRLNFENLRGQLLSSEFIKSQGGVLQFEPDDEMLEECTKVKSRYPTSANKDKRKATLSEHYGFDDNYLKTCKLESIYYKRPQKTKYIDKESLKKKHKGPIKTLIEDLLNLPDKDAEVPLEQDVVQSEEDELLRSMKDAEVPLELDVMQLGEDELLEEVSQDVTEFFEKNRDDSMDVDQNIFDENLSILSQKTNHGQNNIELSINQMWPQIDGAFFSGMKKVKMYVMQYHFQEMNPPIETCLAKYELCELAYFDPLKRPWIMLQSHQLQSLKSNNYVNGYVIDCYMTAKICAKEWENISFLPTSFTQFILGSHRDEIKNKNFIGYKIEHFIEGKLFMPFCLGIHWMILIADVEKGELMELDPMYDQCSLPMAATYFIDYLNDYNRLVPNNEWNLTKIQWKIVPAFPKPRQLDTYNCGLFVMHYMNLAANDDFSKEGIFQPDEFRIDVAEYLMQESALMNDECLGCTKNDNNYNYQCQNCRRWLHERCAAKGYYCQDRNLCIHCNGLDIDNFQVKVGFPNPQGTNSCWLNASLRLLVKLPIFDILTMNTDHDDNLLSNIKALKKCLEFEIFGVYKIEKTLTNLKKSLNVLNDSFVSNQQQDAYDFIMNLFHYFSTNFEAISPAFEDFTYCLVETFQCLFCLKEKKIEDTGFILDLYFNENMGHDDQHLNNLISQLFKKKLSSLDCLTCQRETLHTMVRAYFKKSQPYLLFAVCRYSNVGHKLFKRNNRVNMSDIINCDSLFVDNIGENNYSLIGIICHEGTHVHSGHYTAYIYDSATKNWIFYDDEFVEIIDNFQEVLDRSCHQSYLCLYELNNNL